MAPLGRYLQLVRQFPLRRLKSRADADAATAILDEMFGRPSADLGEQQYAEALALLLAAYEQEQEKADASQIAGRDVLEHLMEGHGMKQLELAKTLGIGASAASMILRGQRPITAEHARRLGKRFGIDPGVFL